MLLKQHKNKAMQEFKLENDFDERLKSKKNEQLANDFSNNCYTARRFYSSNNWDNIIAKVIEAAGYPLTVEEIREVLEHKSLLPIPVDSTKHVYPKILHAQKREVIEQYRISGDRKLYYCLPSWIDSYELLKEEFRCNALVLEESC
ncbi:hypothetical protein DN068_20260 [Taibaiella soli]|uniref:Uncharacterized protein n=2 Tax=Taibaiella soli TaxID=1649169 RepID=A0A2W2BBL1_9BACT|nr:hypothetical protein DN068_20260 [Taibaiella soli]